MRKSDIKSLTKQLNLLKETELLMKKRKLPAAPAAEVTITPRMARAAEQKNSSHCAIAEAIKLLYPWATGIAVDLQTIRFSDPKKVLRYVYLTPRVAQQYIVDFDRGETTAGLSFKLRRGHVMPMKRKSANEAAGERTRYLEKKDTPEYKKASENIRLREKLRHSVLHDRGRGPHSLPDPFGGAPPPIAPGRRREFGIRGLR